MFPISRALYGALAVLLGSPAQAIDKPADSAQARANTLVAEVLAVHPDLVRLEAAVEAAVQRQRVAAALPDPHFSLELAPDTIGGFTAPDGRRRALARSLQLHQELPWPGTLALREERARQQSLSQAEALADQRLQMAALTRAAYARWVYLHRALDINRQGQALLGQWQSQHERRYRDGLEAQETLLRIGVRSAALERERLHLEHGRHEVRAQINALRQQAPDTPLALPPAWTPAPALPALEALNARAVRSHPRLREAEAGRQQARAQLALANKDFYPRIELSAGHSDFAFAPALRTRIGASLQLPFGQGRRQAARDAAQAELSGAEAAIEGRRSELLSQLEQAYAQAVDAQRALALIDQRWLPRARQALAASRDRYASGGGHFRDLIEAETDLLTAELERARSAADGFIARAWIKRWSASTEGESS